MFDYELADKCIVFKNTIVKKMPYVAQKPRNHESLFFVTDGALIYKHKKEKTVVKKGQVGYIPRGNADSSSAYLCDSVSYIATNFSFDENAENPLKTLPFHTLCSSNSAYYEVLFAKAYNAYNSHFPAFHILTKAILLEIIGSLYNELMLKDISKRNIETIDCATDYIKSHYTNPDFTISQLAAACNVSQRNLRRLFASVYQKRPFNFLQEFRISQAEILLSSTNKSMTQIAQQCGFSDVYAFSHCYKKHRNISPSAYRNEHL